MKPRKFNPRTLGIFMLIPSILIVITSILYTVVVILGIGYYITWFSLPVFISLGYLLFAAFTLYTSIRFIRNRPFKRSRTLGNILIFGGALYFFYRLSTVIYWTVIYWSPGHSIPWLRILLILLLSTFFVSLGFGMKGSYKNF